MGAFSVQFSMRFTDPATKRVRTEQYPVNRKGQEHNVRGIDPEAAYLLRKGQLKTGDVKLSAPKAKALAKALVDGGRVAAYEKPVYNAVIRAARGQKVEITDDTGHWRKLSLSKTAADTFKAGVKGTHMAG